ncbi:MAG: PhnD/SsuA/transferrin family substrate-binding protein [Nitrospirota bacterium]|nr:PhnD/SsuA/transferrin family substrate-binding protein [Nitrospirota bacterium]
MRRYIILLVLVLIFASPAYPAETAYLGIIPFYAPEKIWNLYSPLIEYLNRTTGITWELKLYHNHDATIDAICKGDISIALFGPVPFTRAQDKCGVKPLLVALSGDGRPYYRSILITGDLSVNSLGDLKGREFGFFQGSTAAYVLPRKMLEDEGITMDMIKPVFLKGQDKIMDALLKHEIAAAGVKESLFEKFRGEGTKVLRISKPVPNFVFCASPGIDRGIESRFVQALLKVRPLSRPADKKTVQGWDDEVRNGFIPAPETYSGEALMLLDLFRKYEK